MGRGGEGVSRGCRMKRGMGLTMCGDGGEVEDGSNGNYSLQMTSSASSPPPLRTSSSSIRLGLGLILGSPSSESPKPQFGRGQAHGDPLTANRAVLLRATSSTNNVHTSAVPNPPGELDQSRLDPDDLFRALSVGEVRRVEARLRWVLWLS